jgi:oligoribonuclease
VDKVLADTSTQHILWIDLEMTGLEATKDVIVEVAAIATDWEFNEIASFESGVGQDLELTQKLLDANPFYSKMKDNKAAMLELAENSPPSKVIEGMLVKFVTEHCDTHWPVVMAGNSIHIDRQFIKHEWPFLDQLLHYRMLDVTSWKLVYEAKYGTKFEKKETHRALGDIRESISELKYYLEKVNV